MCLIGVSCEEGKEKEVNLLKDVKSQIVETQKIINRINIPSPNKRKHTYTENLPKDVT